MTDAAAKKIGFIGTGIMGKPMVRNLVKAGYEVVIHNRSQRSVDELTAESDKLTAAGSPADVARAADTVILMLPDSPDVRDVVFGENGVLHVQPDKIVPGVCQRLDQPNRPDLADDRSADRRAALQLLLESSHVIPPTSVQ
jgi:predicted dinucleotide-binding enzyme